MIHRNCALQHINQFHKAEREPEKMLVGRTPPPPPPPPPAWWKSASSGVTNIRCFLTFMTSSIFPSSLICLNRRPASLS